MIEKNGKILVSRRKKGGQLEGKWEFPGGKLEEGETPKQCLERELLEEFGIKTGVNDFVGSSKHEYSHGLIELLAYKVKHLSGEFKLNEHEEIKWILLKEFEKYDFVEADIAIVEKIKEG